jgi:hypothetical protein
MAALVAVMILDHAEAFARQLQRETTRTRPARNAR